MQVGLICMPKPELTSIPLPSIAQGRQPMLMSNNRLYELGRYCKWDVGQSYIYNL